MFVPDLLHEFELGVWKSFFLHMLRILYAFGHDTIQELNSWCLHHNLLPKLHSYVFPFRYRQVPTFGRDTIRQFGNNVSAMKRLAGRDFEDLLQVC